MYFGIRFFRGLCFIFLFVIVADAQIQLPNTSSDVLKTLKGLNTYVDQIRNKNKNDEFIRNKAPLIILKIKELQDIFSNSQEDKLSKIYLESLVVYEIFFKKYAGTEIKPPDDKLKNKFEELDKELNAKLVFAKASRGNISSSISVVIKTIRNGMEEGGYEVWYVPKGWADEKDHYQRFDNLSSPSIMDLPPGNYFIWTLKGNSKTEPRPLSLGEDKRSKRVIELNVP